MMVRLVPFLICALFIFPVSSVAEMRSPLDVARQLGMSDAEIENVRKGNVGVEELEASSDKDLSIALIARLDAPVAKVDAFLKSDRLVEISTVTKSTGQIDPSNFSIDALDLPAGTLEQAPLVLQDRLAWPSTSATHGSDKRDFELSERRFNDVRHLIGV